MHVHVRSLPVSFLPCRLFEGSTLQFCQVKVVPNALQLNGPRFLVSTSILPPVRQLHLRLLRHPPQRCLELFRHLALLRPPLRSFIYALLPPHLLPICSTSRHPHLHTPSPPTSVPRSLANLPAIPRSTSPDPTAGFDFETASSVERQLPRTHLLRHLTCWLEPFEWVDIRPSQDRAT